MRSRQRRRNGQMGTMMGSIGLSYLTFDDGHEMTLDDGNFMEISA